MSKKVRKTFLDPLGHVWVALWERQFTLKTRISAVSAEILGIWKCAGTARTNRETTLCHSCKLFHIFVSRWPLVFCIFLYSSNSNNSKHSKHNTHLLVRVRPDDFSKIFWTEISEFSPLKLMLTWMNTTVVVYWPLISPNIFDFNGLV